MSKVYPDSVIVDDDDNVIGHMQMPDAIKQGKNLQIARVLVVNSKGEMLLQQRGKAVIAPFLWNDAAAGHVDEGQDYIQAALAELSEETGIVARADELKEIAHYFTEEVIYQRTTGRFQKVFLVESDEEPKIIDPDEVEAFRWVAIDELKIWMHDAPEQFTLGFKFVFDEYLKTLGEK